MSEHIYDSTIPYCKICGKPFQYIGDVPGTGWPIGHEPYCTCIKTVPVLGGFEFPKKPFKFCPHCGERL